MRKNADSTVQMPGGQKPQDVRQYREHLEEEIAKLKQPGIREIFIQAGSEYAYNEMIQSRERALAGMAKGYDSIFSVGDRVENLQDRRRGNVISGNKVRWDDGVESVVNEDTMRPIYLSLRRGQHRIKRDYGGEPETPYEEGEDWCEDGGSIQENPYNKETAPDEYEEWREGWFAGYDTSLVDNEDDDHADGYAAGKVGKPKDTSESKEWFEGWMEGRYDAERGKRLKSIVQVRFHGPDPDADPDEPATFNTEFEAVINNGRVTVNLPYGVPYQIMDKIAASPVQGKIDEHGYKVEWREISK